jgi:hypothetical protein
MMTNAGQEDDPTEKQKSSGVADFVGDHRAMKRAPEGKRQARTSIFGLCSPCDSVSMRP